ncbi:MAG: site-2 protease family protein [Acidobacteriota bacterium]
MMRPGNIFRQQFEIARIGGIPIRADYRWFPVVLFFTVAAAAVLRPMVEDWLAAFLLGCGVTLAFFLSVLIHEFSHAAVAIRQSLQVFEVVLHPFGGFSRFRQLPETPRAEFLIAAAGPLASLALCLIFAVAGWLSLALHLDIIAFFFIITAAGNLLLGFFNLLPGYPLDGGRLLRAYLWKQGRSFREATSVTGKLGQFIGAAIIFAGLFIGFAGGQWLASAWSVVIGIFLFDSARSILLELSKEEYLRVCEVMRLPKLLDPELTIQEMADNILPMFRNRAFPIVKNGHFSGILLLSDVRRLDRRQWRTTRLKSIVRPASFEMTLSPDTSIAEARELMRLKSFPAIAVIDANGAVIGILDESYLSPAPRA